MQGCCGETTLSFLPPLRSVLDPPGLHKTLRARFGLQAEPPLQLKTVYVAQLPQQGAVPIRAHRLRVEFDGGAQAGPGVGALLSWVTVIVGLLLLRSGLWIQSLVRIWNAGC